MIKRVFTVPTLDGGTKDLEYYFHLSKAELVEKELLYPGGYTEYLRTMLASGDRAEMIKTFKDLILDSVGVRGDDDTLSKRGVRDKFADSEAYSQLFMEITTQPGKSVEFFKGCMPSDMHAEIEKGLAGLEQAETPIPKKLAEYNIHELEAMDYESFKALIEGAKGTVPLEVLQLAMRRRP